MRRVVSVVALLSCLFAAMSGPALADDDDDDDHRRWRGGERKEEFHDGRCKIEREWKKDGSYKEERKCDEPRRRAPHWALGWPHAVVMSASPPFAMDFAPAPQLHLGAPVARGARPHYCREYRMDALVDGRPQRLFGTACLEPDGAWSIVQ